MDISSLHPKQFNYLTQAFVSDKLHHSHVFYGPKGGGKFLFSLYLAKFIQCSSKEGDKPCEKCNNCRVSRDGFVINTYIINQPDNESIKIGEVKQLQKEIELSIGKGNRKIFIINNAQNLGREAREVLLKTLEEPPPKSLIILITDEKRLLPKTILSRCPAMYFPRPKVNSIGPALTLYFNNLEILKQHDQVQIEEEYQTLVNELKTIFGDSVYNKMNLVKDIGSNEDLNEKTEKWISILYKLLMIKIGLSSQEDDQLKDLEKNLDYDRIIKVLEKLLNILNLLDTNVSKRILFEDLVLNIGD